MFATQLNSGSYFQGACLIPILQHYIKTFIGWHTSNKTFGAENIFSAVVGFTIMMRSLVSNSKINMSAVWNNFRQVIGDLIKISALTQTWPMYKYTEFISPIIDPKFLMTDSIIKYCSMSQVRYLAGLLYIPITVFTTFTLFPLVGYYTAYCLDWEIPAAYFHSLIIFMSAQNYIWVELSNTWRMDIFGGMDITANNSQKIVQKILTDIFIDIFNIITTQIVLITILKARDLFKIKIGILLFI